MQNVDDETDEPETTTKNVMTMTRQPYFPHVTYADRCSVQFTMYT